MGTSRVRRNDTGLRFLGAAAAPWAAGLGLLISFTASAGTDTRLDAGLVPGLDAHITPALPSGTTRAGLRARGARQVGASVLRVDTSESVTGVISPGSATWSPDLEPEGFVAVPDLGLGPAPDADDAEPSDGATPPVPRAVALSSMTPAPADSVPVEIAAANLALPGFSPRLDRGPAPDSDLQETPDGTRHRYADLIEPEKMDREQRCLAEAVYFEARSEPEEGQAAVAQVVLNRVKSGLYPGNVCGVVYQNRHRYMGCQFSFACEGKSLRITDAGSWASATRIVSAVIAGRTYLSEVGDATHYHANYVRPGWSRRLKKMDVIGRHIFYELKRGQT